MAGLFLYAWRDPVIDFFFSWLKCFPVIICYMNNDSVVLTFWISHILNYFQIGTNPHTSYCEFLKHRISNWSYSGTWPDCYLQNPSSFGNPVEPVSFKNGGRAKEAVDGTKEVQEHEVILAPHRQHLHALICGIPCTMLRALSPAVTPWLARSLFSVLLLQNIYLVFTKHFFLNYTHLVPLYLKINALSLAVTSGGNLRSISLVFLLHCWMAKSSPVQGWVCQKMHKPPPFKHWTWGNALDTKLEMHRGKCINRCKKSPIRSAYRAVWYN